ICASAPGPAVAASRLAHRTVVSTPRRNMACPVGTSAAASFMNASLTMNALIAASIARMPRRLSDVAVAGIDGARGRAPACLAQGVALGQPAVTHGCILTGFLCGASAARDAHVPRHRWRACAAVDDEIVSLGLARDSVVDGRQQQ